MVSKISLFHARTVTKAAAPNSLGRLPILVCFSLSAGCSTVQSRTGEPPIFEQSTLVSISAFEGCFTEKTGKQDVMFLPRSNGGRFSAGVMAGASRYVTWVVDITDHGDRRHVEVFATHANSKLALPAVTSCL